MKRLVIIPILIILASVLIVGCGQETTPAPAPAPASTATPAPASTATPAPAPSSPTPAPAPAATPVKPITLKYSYDVPPMVPPAQGPNYWAEEVTNRTEGRVKVDVYPAAAISSQALIVDNILAGVVDVGYVALSTQDAKFPVGSVCALPGLGFPDDEEGQTAMIAAFRALIEKHPAVAADFKDFEILFDVVYQEAYLVSRDKQVRVPDDVNGMKVGCSGKRMDLMAKLGAATVFDVPPIAYEKLQTGVTDASFLAWAAISDFQLADVAKYALDLGFGGSMQVQLMKKDVWNKISPQDQKIMMDLVPEAERRSSAAQGMAAEAARKKWAELGRTTTVPTQVEVAQWQDKFSLIWEDWIAQNEASGVTDARAVLDDWKAMADKAWGR